MWGRSALLLGIAARHIAARRRQTVVAITGVAVGVGFFLAVSALMVGSQKDFISTLIDSAPHIIISDELRTPPPQPAVRVWPNAAIALHGYKPRNEMRGLKDWQKIIKAVQVVPGATASPSLSGGIALRVGGREEAVGIVGIDPEVESRISDLDSYLAKGRIADLTTSQGAIIIGEELAQRLGVGMGDMVGAVSPSGSTRALRIVGLFERGRGQMGAGSGYVLLREAQSLLGRPFIINRIGVRLKDPYLAQDVAAQLERQFGYKSQSWQERSADFMTLLLTRNIIMYTVVSAILLVASFGIYSVVSNSVNDKKRDIAIMRSMGFSQADLQKIFVAEGLALALLGIIAGWTLGYALMAILASLEFSIMGRIEHMPVDKSPLQYAIAGGVSLISAVIASWLPARKAARVDPVDILRGAA